MHVSSSAQTWLAPQNNRTSLAALPTTATRVLCLKLQEQTSTGFKARKRTPHAIAESFLQFSPRVVYRLGESNETLTLWVFIDIASTSHFFAEDRRTGTSRTPQALPEAAQLKQLSGEEGVAQAALLLSQDLGFGAQYAIADTPAGAQAFAHAHPDTIIPMGEERERLKDLSLPLLLSLEGLVPWEKPSQVEHILTFFLMIGFKTAGDLAKLSAASFQERWGKTGALLWKRLHALDRAAISPLIPTEPLQDYVHLDFPLSLVSLVLHHSEKSLDYLFARLAGRRLFARKLVLILHCEYSSARHKIEIEPNVPSRDRELFATLLENRLDALNLENPIRDFEMFLVPCEEKVQQLDFFEPRTTDTDKLQTLFSLLLQSALRPGVYKIENAILPERSYSLVSDPQEVVKPEAMTERRLSGAKVTGKRARAGAGEQMVPAHGGSHQASMVSEPQAPYEASGETAAAFTYEPAYGDTVMTSPRPTRLLNEPSPLTIEALGKLKILSSTPIERLEDAWWEEPKPGSLGTRRDYYFAVSPEGQCLWIFQDLMTDEYFVHGYFD